MKRKILFFILTTASLFSKQNWSQQSKMQAEIANIQWAIADIKNQFTRMGRGAQSTGAYQGAIFNYLRNLGSPASLQVLKDMVASGELPATLLNLV